MSRRTGAQDVPDWLQDLAAFGLHGLRARIYAELLQGGESISGYETAKRLGVARANVYDALRQLVQAGLVLEQDRADSTLYRAVPFEALAARVRDDLEARLRRLRAHLASSRLADGTWQGSGWGTFRAAVGELVTDGPSFLRIGASPGPVRHIADLLDRPVGLAPAFGCWSQCPPSGCGVCRPPVSALPPVGLAEPCVLLAPDRVVWTEGPESHAAVLVSDYPPILEAVGALLAPIAAGPTAREGGA